MGRTKRLLSNTVILGAGTFASKVLVFLLMPLYTAVLSTSEFGVADILTQTANLLMPLAAVGICDAIFRFVLDTGNGEDNAEDARKRIFTSAIAVLLGGGAVTVVLVQILRIFDVFDGYVFLIAAYVICANLRLAAANFLRAIGKTTLFAVQGIINTALTISLNLLFLLGFGMGTLGYVLSVVISDLIMTVMIFIVARLYRYLSLKSINKQTIRVMLKFSIPYIPTTIMWFITSASDRYIVTAFGGSAENGLYAAAYKLPTLILLICGVFIEAWQFSVVKDAKEKERADFFGEVFRNYMGVIFMGASTIIAGATILTKLLLADSYYSSYKYVPVLVIAMTFSALVTFLGSVYFVEKKSVMSMLTSMAGAIINIVLNFILIPSRGAMGAAVATAISYAAVYVIRVIDTRNYLKFNMHSVCVAINTSVLVAQTVILIAGFKYWIYFEIGLVVFMLVFNGRGIVGSISEIFSKIVKKRKKMQEN